MRIEQLEEQVRKLQQENSFWPKLSAVDLQNQDISNEYQKMSLLANEYSKLSKELEIERTKALDVHSILKITLYAADELKIWLNSLFF
jgi:hypothetical protein